ncbi:hypothetical protein [Desulfatibacillum aliphaticivorans]|uniref:hypothetical protein n=1 Tax=Desulfatibacillum aliphaticivorans TaxID=218208 RepID=UPI0012FB2922|nr:hypothetical protein [Desulfatibacillum aliphaticivorans]
MAEATHRAAEIMIEGLNTGYLANNAIKYSTAQGVCAAEQMSCFKDIKENPCCDQ